MAADVVDIRTARPRRRRKHRAPPPPPPKAALSCRAEACFSCPFSRVVRVRVLMATQQVRPAYGCAIAEDREFDAPLSAAMPAPGWCPLRSLTLTVSLDDGGRR